MRGSVSVVKRLGHRPMHLPSPDQTLDLVRLDTSWWSVAEFMAPIWGPLSLYGRWVHAPRFVANHKLRSDDDVTFGLSAAVALDSPLLDLL